MPFICKPANPEPIPWANPIIYFLYFEPLSPFSLHSRARYQTLGTALFPKTHWNDSDYPMLNLITLLCPFLFTRTTTNALACIFPSLALLPDQPWCSPVCLHPHGMACCLLWICECNKWSFQWQSYLHLLVLPHLNNNKIYVLKQCDFKTNCPWVLHSYRG